MTGLLQRSVLCTDGLLLLVEVTHAWYGLGASRLADIVHEPFIKGMR
jgi:hypothetical protein